MNRRARDLQAILLTAFAATPLYVTQAVPPMIVAAFHLTLALVAIAVFRGRGTTSLSTMGRAIAIGYLPFFIADAVWISSSLIRASVHLLFFIAIYQILDPAARAATHQRLLVTFLIFTTSIATATHLSILLFIALFTVAAFAELMRLSQEESLRTSENDFRSVAASAVRPPRILRSAILFAIPTALIAALLFPALPRRENPFVRGMARGFDNSSTGISDTIDFNDNRRISSDPSAIARVWIPQETVPFFTPLRMRAMVYDVWAEGEWASSMYRNFEPVSLTAEGVAIARPQGLSFQARIEQKELPRARMLLPDGTWQIRGPDQIWLAESQGVASIAERGSANFSVAIARQTEPRIARPVAPPAYPIPTAVAALAREIVGDETDPIAQARRIETHLSTQFTYLEDPSSLGRAVPVDEFLLATKRGHCEYFAAGMVVLLASLDVPARIVGGYYGGELNPLIGSFVIRARDAHAWVEVWDGSKWVTHDPTPAALRPGTDVRNLLNAYWEALRDSATYFWDRYILTFGRNDQVELILRAFSAVRSTWTSMRGKVAAAGEIAREQGPVVLVVVALIASAAAAIYFIRRRRSDYERLLAILEDRGIGSDSSTTPLELLGDVRTLRPDLVPLVEPIVEAYVREKFAATPPSEDLRTAAKRAMRSLATSRAH